MERKNYILEFIVKMQNFLSEEKSMKQRIRDASASLPTAKLKCRFKNKYQI